MAYTPTTWVTGDTVTATKLNKLEQGVANVGSAMIVTNTNDVLDKTFAEIYTALKNGVPVYCKVVAETDGPATDYTCITVLNQILAARKYDNVYAVYVVEFQEGVVPQDAYAPAPAIKSYKANGMDGYPAFNKVVYPSTVSFDD